MFRRGFATRALGTVTLPNGDITMLLLPVHAATVDRTGWDTHGMQAAMNGRMTFDAVPAGTDALLGKAG